MPRPNAGLSRRQTGRRRLWDYPLVLALWGILWASCSAAAEKPQIWMAATEPFWRQVRQWPANDYMELFDDAAPWRSAASAVRVFQVSRNFVLRAPEDELVRVISGLRKRNLALAVQGTGLFASAECGLGVEGYGPPSDMLRLAMRLQQLGGELRYIALDEPLHFGRQFKERHGKKGCQRSVPEIANQVSAKIADVKRIFPKVVVGDVEPVGSLRANWLPDLEEWLDAYAAATKERLGFFRADVIWERPGWPAQLAAIRDLLARRGIPLALIYNGRRANMTDEEWTDTAERNASTVECSLGIKPAQVAIQTWMDRPRSLLPETQRGTLTNLVLRYVNDLPCH
jgi:hypothetical protein